MDKRRNLHQFFVTIKMEDGKKSLKKSAMEKRSSKQKQTTLKKRDQKQNGLLTVN